MFCSLMDMLIECMELGLLIAGIIALFRGKLALTRELATEGTAARLAGLIFLLPFPLSIGLRSIAAAAMAPPPPPPFQLGNEGTVAFVEWTKQKEALTAQLEVLNSAIVLGVFLACIVLAVLVVQGNRTAAEPKTAASDQANVEG
jgi:hypothetical protein